MDRIAVAKQLLLIAKSLTAGGWGRFGEDLYDSIMGVVLQQKNKTKRTRDLIRIINDDAGLVQMMEDEGMTEADLTEMLEDNFTTFIRNGASKGKGYDSADEAQDAFEKKNQKCKIKRTKDTDSEVKFQAVAGEDVVAEETYKFDRKDGQWKKASMKVAMAPRRFVIRKEDFKYESTWDMILDTYNIEYGEGADWAADPQELLLSATVLSID